MGDILDRLQRTHLQACMASRPAPEELAKRLFSWELTSEWDTFHGAAATYADVLGAKGLAAYRILAEAAWARIVPLVPGADDADRYGSRFRITHIMETLARQTDNVEEIVAVKKRDLSSPYGFLEVAETYKQCGKDDLAVEWAARGVNAFQEQTDPRLLEFLANEYHLRSRHDEAMQLAWSQFSGSPCLERYQAMKRHADLCGQWSSWRVKALSAMREAVVKTKRREAGVRSDWASRAHSSELVKVFVWEGDAEAAWREAKSDGCSDSLWLNLAAKREEDHPEDALSVYQDQVARAVARTNNYAYQEAMSLLRKARAVMLRLGRDSEFRQYIASVRAANKAKRNFVKLLDAEKWQ
jgi:uncharacterized Zn finger protein